MNLEEKWQKALSETEIIRSRIAYLSTFEATTIPYIFLAKSSVNLGDTVVRKGKVLVNRPEIVLPEDMPQFEGFEFEQEYNVNADMVRLLLFVRGISFPSLKYAHEVSEIDVKELSLDEAKKYFKHRLERTENIETGLIVGPEECWQFSLLIYVGMLIGRSASSDVRRIWERFQGSFGPAS